MVNQKAYQFQQAIQAPNPKDRKAMLQTFIDQNNYDITPQELIAIAQMVCAVAEVVCPIINNL